jgi:CDP-diacylglycerol---glycerol-3-phosphate 3-phosphatidyltransferase
VPAPEDPKDFRRLRESGDHASLGRYIGGGFCAARDTLARGLAALGITPNHLTVAGFLLTCGTGACLAIGAGHQVPYWAVDAPGGGGASWWPLGAGLFLIASSACDMIDGALARITGSGSDFGAFLDSTLDRFSDIAIIVGISIYFARDGNLTYQLLALFALANTFLISYIKARAEEIVPDCSVGWWQRGERHVTFLLGCFFGHIPAILWQLTLLPAFTVWRRLTFAHQAITAQAAGHPLPSPLPPRTGWGRWKLSQHPRGSWQHDLVAGANIAYIIFAPLIFRPLLATGPYSDPLRAWLGGG